jgi:hypothetical protein
MWKLYTKNENVRPPADETTHYRSKEEALRAACDQMKVAHVAVLYIEGPDGEMVDSPAITTWCRSSQATTSK